MKKYLFFSFLLLIFSINIHAAWVDADGVGQESSNISQTITSSFWGRIITDQSNNPHIVWLDNNDVYYLHWNGSAWVDVTGSSGRGAVNVSNTGIAGTGPVISLDAGVPYISWGESSGEYCQKWNGSAWVGMDNTVAGRRAYTGPVIAGYLALDTEGGHHSMVWDGVNYITWTGSAWTAPAYVGSGAAGYIQIDGTGKQHIIYMSNYDIYYEYYNGSAWVGANGGPALSDMLVASGAANWTDYLALDSAGHQNIVYTKNGEVYYVKWNGSSWVGADGSAQESASVSNSGGSVIMESMALDNAGMPNIAWRDGTYDIDFLRWNGSEWVDADGAGQESKKVTTTAGVSADKWIWMTVSGDNTPHIVWSQNLAGNDEVFYLKYVPNQQNTPTPAPTIAPTPACPGAGCVDWAAANMNAAFPKRHEQASLVFGGKMWVITGADNVYPHYRDAWWSVNGADWYAATQNTAFMGRAYPGKVVYNDGSGDKMWIAGGNMNGVNVNDVWYSGNGADWLLATGNAAFAPRTGQAMVSYNGRMWLIGGGLNSSGPPYGHSNDVWWSTDGKNWNLATSNAAFAPRSAPAVVVFNDGSGDKMWLIGGATQNDDYHRISDVWYSSNGADWTLATGNAGFQGRSNMAAFVYDNELMITCGFGNSGAMYRDVWRSPDGVHWYLCNMNPPYPMKDTEGVVYNGVAWILGGMAGSGTLNDVWYTCGLMPVLTQTPPVTPVPTAVNTPAPTSVVTLASTATPVEIRATPAPQPTVCDHDSVCYPTRCDRDLKIVFNCDRHCGVKIYIYSFSGDFIENMDYDTGEAADGSAHKVHLDVSRYAPGIYYYVIQGKTQDGRLINYRSNKFIVGRK
jgi:hypothetical protein